MVQSDAHWRRLDREFAVAIEILDALEAAARKRQAAPDLARLAAARVLASRVARALEHSGSTDAPSDWRAWVDAETAGIELRFEIRHLVAGAGTLRQDYLAAVAQHVVRLETEIGKLQNRSSQFRPRTRLAIGRDVERLQRRLDVLREEMRRLEGSGQKASENAAGSVGRAWSDADSAVDAARMRFARPRWRQGREARL